MASSSPVWVLLPGFDGSGSLFARFLEALPPGMEARVLSYPPDRPLDYVGLRLLLECELPRTPYILVAESFAGPLALQLAGRRDPLLRGLVLCATFVTNPRPLLSAFVRDWMIRRLARRAPPRWLLRWLLLNGHRDDRLESAVVASVQRLHPEVMLARWRALRDVDGSMLLAECPVPVRILKATGDRLLGNYSFRVMQGCSSKLDSIDIEAPHFLLQCEPRVATSAILEFCRRVSNGNSVDR